jgi:hypothetical protein
MAKPFVTDERTNPSNEATEAQGGQQSLDLEPAPSPLAPVLQIPTRTPPDAGRPLQPTDPASSDPTPPPTSRKKTRQALQLGKIAAEYLAMERRTVFGLVGQEIRIPKKDQVEIIPPQGAGEIVKSIGQISRLRRVSRPSQGPYFEKGVIDQVA